MIDKADAIFFMEQKHLDIVRKRFTLGEQTIGVLDIEDLYPLNDPELIEILRVSLAGYL